jgi:hypothetical protein
MVASPPPERTRRPRWTAMLGLYRRATGWLRPAAAAAEPATGTMPVRPSWRFAAWLRRRAHRSLRNAGRASRSVRSEGQASRTLASDERASGRGLPGSVRKRPSIRLNAVTSGFKPNSLTVPLRRQAGEARWTGPLESPDRHYRAIRPGFGILGLAWPPQRSDARSGSAGKVLLRSAVSAPRRPLIVLRRFTGPGRVTGRGLATSQVRRWARGVHRAAASGLAAQESSVTRTGLRIPDLTAPPNRSDARPDPGIPMLPRSAVSMARSHLLTDLGRATGMARRRPGEAQRTGLSQLPAGESSAPRTGPRVLDLTVPPKVSARPDPEGNVPSRSAGAETRRFLTVPRAVTGPAHRSAGAVHRSAGAVRRSAGTVRRSAGTVRRVDASGCPGRESSVTRTGLRTLDLTPPPNRSDARSDPGGKVLPRSAGPVVERPLLRASRLSLREPRPSLLGQPMKVLSQRAAEETWRSSVAAHPLENPEPLPGRYRPLARSLTGRSDVRFTTGPATREALAAVGAVGATSGSLVHLPRRPGDGDVGVLAHELAHVRTVVGRPRFLRPGISPARDSEEQRAVAAAAAPPTPPRPAPPRLAPSRSTPTVAPRVDRLPVSGVSGVPNLVQTQVNRTLAATTATESARAVPPESTPSSPDAAGGASPEPASPDQGAPPLDLDTIVDALEVRLLHDIERRGGRFEGVF